MNPKKIGLILLIGITLFFFLCSSPAINNWEINTGNGKPNKIIFFGDSLTTGYGLKDNADSYPNQVASLLKLPMTLYGYNGCTTEAALPKLPDLIKEAPALVIVTLGGNDILRRKKLKDTEKNLRTIFTELQKMKHTIVFTEVLSFFDGDRHEMHIRLCKEFGITLIPDILAGMMSDTDKMQADIHPDTEGCKVIAERVVTILKKMAIVN